MKSQIYCNRGSFDPRGGEMARIAAVAENKFLSISKFLCLSLSLVSLLLVSAAGLAQSVPATVTLVTNLTYLDPVKGEVQVRIVYTGTHLQGRAVATNTTLDGAEIVDEMRDCRLTIASEAWSITCRNPHFRTWDSGRTWYAVSSELVTQGKLTYFDLVGPVTMSLRYAAPIQ